MYKRFRKSFRRFSKKRKTYRKKKSYVKKSINRALASRGLSKPEWKHARDQRILNSTNAAFDAPGISLLPASQGVTGYQDFVGKKICAKSITMSGMFYNGTSLMKCVRLILVEDLQPMDSSNLSLYNATGTTVTQGYHVLITDDIHALYNDVYPRRWKMLWDKTWMLGGKADDYTLDAPENNRIKFFKKIRLGNAMVSYATGAVSGMYPVNRNYILFLVAETTGLVETWFTDLAYTDV